MAVRVNLSQNKATLVDGGVSGIENVNGGAGDDVLIGNSLANQLFGNGGRDILIGGLGADILNGGVGDDILIGGSTTFDGDVAFTALNAIMSEWTTYQLYATRRLHLLGLLDGGLNGASKLTNSTVQPDVDLDKLTGGNDTDWFWGNANEILDLNAALGEKIGVN
jgi:Ca2+-binding RTX toxin-like protein